MSMPHLLFPVSPRNFPGRRLTRAILRAVHILGGGVLVGAYLFHQSAEVIHTWYIAAIISGLLLFTTDLHASFAVVYERRGLSILLKMALLMLIPVLLGFEVWLLIAILTIGAVSSHLPWEFRHRLWWTPPNIIQDQRRG